jgi:hypothetical protein
LFFLVASHLSLIQSSIAIAATSDRKERVVTKIDQLRYGDKII